MSIDFMTLGAAMKNTEESLSGNGVMKGEPGEKGDPGIDGKSAYDIWLEAGNTGTEEDFLDSLRGEPGDMGESGSDGASAYEIWIDEGNSGTEQDFLDSLKGEKGTDGKSAYQAWLDAGNTGTEQDFLDSLKGADGTMTFEDLTEEQKESLKGFTPTITPNPDNTDKNYRLDITTKDGTFTTPNLRGGDEVTKYTYLVDGTGVTTYYSYVDLSTKVGETVSVTVSNKYGMYDTELTIINIISDTELTVSPGGGEITIILVNVETTTAELINDNITATTSTWSSQKIADELEQVFDTLTDELEQVFDNLTPEQKEEIRGIQGDDGKSAYDIWLEAGNTGSEAEFIESLKGAEGFTPVVTVEEIESGHKVSIEDSDGVKEFEVLDGKGITTSLDELGLTAPVSIGEVFNAMPDKTMLMLNVNNTSNEDATVTDAPHNQGVLLINKHNNGRFSIEFNYSLGGNGNTIRKWIGTLKGSDGTGLNWKEVAYSNDHGMKSYSSLSDLELDTTATINDIIGKMANNSMFVYKTDVFDLTQYENLQFATVTIIKQSANRVQAIMTDKDTGDLYIGRMDSSNKIVGWTKVATEEIVHTSLSGNLADITTVLDLVNALLTEYRATSPKKPIRFVSGEITKTTLTDLPVTYGVLQITVAGWDVVEVRLAHSANGFKTMYYGFMNRISGEESISSITWQAVATTADHNMNTYTNVTQLGLSSPCSVIDIIKKLPKNSQLIYGSYGSETHNGGYITDAPATHGLLEVKKSDYDGCRATMTFTESATNSMGYKRKWVAEFASGSGNIDTNGVKWHEVAYKAVADVGFTTINQTNGLTAPTGITMTDGSKVNYCIRNGICYVHIALQISSISAKVNSWTVIAELPKSVIEAVGAMNCESNTVPDCMPIRVSQAGKLTLMYKGTTTSTSDWWSYSFSYPVAE